MQERNSLQWHISKSERNPLVLLRRIGSLDGGVALRPVRQHPVIELCSKAIQKGVYARGELKSRGFGQAAESHDKYGARVTISYKFPADDSVRFAVR
jgi:hypothetical protein